MAGVLIPIPRRDFDPTEAAVTWSVLTRLGHGVVFATPDGRPGLADDLMVSGEGLDPWGFVPGLRRITLFGRVLRANADGRRAHSAMLRDPAYGSPMRWDAADADAFDGLVLPGGHRARGMREYLESPILQTLVQRFFAGDKPVGAICHGVLLAARATESDGRSVLFGRKTTALTWSLERTASRLGKAVRFWDPGYYRTYPDADGHPVGYMSVQQEVIRALASPSDFLDVPADDPFIKVKSGGIRRDTMDDAAPAFVVRDGAYVSARWPGDAHTFAKVFASMLNDDRGDR